MIGRKKKRTCRIGIFAVAHAVYWDQFPGLYESLMYYYGEACEKVRKNDVEVVDFGMVDSSEKAFAFAPKMLGADVDLVVCDMVTYATSSVGAPILQALGKITVTKLPRYSLLCVKTFAARRARSYSFGQLLTTTAYHG